MKWAVLPALACAAWGASPETPPCGARSSLELAAPEYLGRRAALERALFDGGESHCGYALKRACLDWESGEPDAGRAGFEMALHFCDDKSAGERGVVASALARGDFTEAYAAWMRHSQAGEGDSLILAPYAPAVYAGLSLTSFPPRGPVEYRLPRGAFNPDAAWRLSLLPGAGFLYLGEPGLAARHFAVSAGITALMGYAAYRGLAARDRDESMVAWMDFGLIATFLWQRYYLGGMREAARLALEKNRAANLARVARLSSQLDPFTSSEGK
jgi:hypothetical protein